jgi:SAM-dependent methyltransferase
VTSSLRIPKSALDRPELRERYACPYCGGDLDWTGDEARSRCGASYPLHNGVLQVPSPLSDANLAQAEFFSRLWPEWKQELDFLDRAKLELHPEQLRGAILDVGAGDASLARHFTELDITSTDLVIDGLADLGARAAVCPLGLLPFGAGSFDLVIAFEVLEHIPQDQIPAAVADLQRVLKPGGHLGLSAPAWPIALSERLVRAWMQRCWPRLSNLERWDHPHERGYRAGELERSLGGFEVTATDRLFKSGSALAIWKLNGMLARLRLPPVKLLWLDLLLPFDHGSDWVLVARKV